MARYGLVRLPIHKTTILLEIIKTSDNLGKLLELLLLRFIERIQNSYGKAEEDGSELVLFALKDRILFRSGLMLSSKEIFNQVFRISHLHRKACLSDGLVEEALLELYRA